MPWRRGLACPAAQVSPTSYAKRWPCVAGGGGQQAGIGHIAVIARLFKGGRCRYLPYRNAHKLSKHGRRGEDGMTSAHSRCRRGRSSHFSPKRKQRQSCKPADPSCRKKKRTGRCLFVEQVYPNVRTTNELMPLPAQTTTHMTVYSYAIINEGDAPAVVQVQVGPDGLNYAADVEETIPAGRTGVIAVSRFLRFTRLAVRSLHAEKPTSLKVYFQAQTRK